MKFDLTSDLHLDIHRIPVDEFDWAAHKNPDSNVLVVAGDIANGFKKTVRAMQYAAEHYEHVVWVDGNHDHYNFFLPIVEAEQYVHEKFRDSNVHYLNGGHVTIEGTTFIGCNGWYDFRAKEHKGIYQHVSKQAWESQSNDPRGIRFYKHSPETMAATHAVNLSETLREVHSNANEIVAVTHSAPRNELVGGYGNDILDGAYCNTLMEKVYRSGFEDKIRLWCFGHTHKHYDVVLDGIRYVNHSYGYPGECAGEFKQIDTKASLSVFGEIDP